MLRPSVIGIASLLACATVALPRRAHADAVPPPMPGCPVGSVGQTDHNGPFCSPSQCQTDADCERARAAWGPPSEGEMRCAPHALCIRNETLQSNSGWSMGQPFVRATAVGPCGPEGVCAEGAKCETAHRCVPKDAATGGDAAKREAGPGTELAPVAPKAKTCGCSVVGAPGDELPALGLAGSLVMLGARVRRARDRRRPSSRGSVTRGDARRA